MPTAIASPDGVPTPADDPAPNASRAEILATAAQCFMEHGYFNTSIDDVARRLGATKGRIYHHYPSKADLFFAVYRRGMEMNFQVVEPILEDELDPAERLRQMLVAHCRSMMKTRAFQRVVWEGVEMHLRGATTPEQRNTLAELVAMRVRYAALFRQVMKEAAAAGCIDGDPLAVSEQLMFLTLNAPIFGFAPRPGDTEKDREKLVQHCVKFALRGLGLNRELN